MGRRHCALEPLPKWYMLQRFLAGQPIKGIAYNVGCSYDWCCKCIRQGLYRRFGDSRIVTAKRRIRR